MRCFGISRKIIRSSKEKTLEKTEKQEKGEYGFVGWLIGGLILITTGLLATLQFAKIIPTGTMIPSLLLIIGSIVIVSALYFVNLARKRAPTP